MNKIFFALLTMSCLTTNVFAQFYETPEEVPEENIYPVENYEMEMSPQMEEEMMYPATEVPPEDYMAAEEDFYDPEAQDYVEE